MEEFRRRKEEQISSVDFGDVFGGPPRTLFLWQTGQSQPYNRLLFYDEIFRIGDDGGGVDHRIRALPNALPPSRSRNLPAFMIPASGRRESVSGNQGFYDDVFSQEARSRSATDSGSRSRSTSASTSPRRSCIHDDVALSAVTSMLKPIIVPSQGHRLRMNESSSEQNTHGNLTVASLSNSYMDFAEPSSGSCKQSAGKLVDHPPALSAQSLHMMKSPYEKPVYSCNQLETNTPSSVTISVVHEPESLMEMSDKGFRDDEGEADFMGRCLIEIVPEKRGESSVTAGAVDDAIAWAKQTLRTGKLENF